MRRLTIRRAKRFVASLVTLKVYIEDPTSGELVINNVSCRMLGQLKNGEEKTFEIDERAAKVYVIADKLSKNYCNEFYSIPAGDGDVLLTGKNEFNPASGNAFRFDNNDNEAVRSNRRRGTRKGWIVLIIAIIIGIAAGCLISSYLISGAAHKEKTFSSNGMMITLTDEFREADAGNYTVTYASKNVAVFALKEKFSLLENSENYTLEQYGELLLKNNNLESCELKTEDGLTFCEYDFKNSNNDTYHYYTYVYKSDDAFWMIQFALLKKSADKYEQQIFEWAKSVTFTD